jgi:hypothetical protein
MGSRKAAHHPAAKLMKFFPVTTISNFLALKAKYLSKSTRIPRTLNPTIVLKSESRQGARDMSTETNAPQRRQAKSMPAVAAQPPLRMFIAHQRIATPRAVKQKWSNGPSPGFGHQCEQASCVWQRALTHLSSREPVNGSAHLIHPDMEGTSQPGDIKNLKQRTQHFSAPGLGTRYAAIPYIALANFRKRRDPRTNSEPKHSLLRWPVVSPSSGLTHVNVIPAPVTGGSGNIFITRDTVEIDFIGQIKTSRGRLGSACPLPPLALLRFDFRV